MRLVNKLHSLDGMADGCVATIGNFDGVHVGHRSVIEKLAEEGRQLGLPVAVVLFEPQPREFFAPGQAPPRLTRLREKLMEFTRLPVDVVLLLRFDRSFASLPPETFVERILIDRLNVKFLAVGDDFRFGKDRAGDFATLSAAGRTRGFRVTDTDSVLVGGERVSSTLIREVLAVGDLDAAARFLGRPYSICGRIVSGDRRGRDLGFPTANIALARKNSPIRGVFVVTMQGYGEKPLPGVANIGLRPTIDGSGLVFLETHLLDFGHDLYGRRVEVRFHRKLRDEQRFSGLDELQKQIRCDVDAARAFFREART
jgi:riboflavin kinase / FMN adenylyltransferase